MQATLSFRQECAVLTALPTAIRYYHQCAVQSTTGKTGWAFWLPFIRESYSVYRHLGGSKRYHELVANIPYSLNHECAQSNP